MDRPRIKPDRAPNIVCFLGHASRPRSRSGPLQSLFALQRMAHYLHVSLEINTTGRMDVSLGCNHRKTEGASSCYHVAACRLGRQYLVYNSVKPLTESINHAERLELYSVID